MTAFPTEYLTANITWSEKAAAETMESGSDIHIVTQGFNPVITKGVARWVAPPATIAALRDLFVVQDKLVGIYTFTDPILGAVKIQSDGQAFSFTQTSMTRWEATMPVRVV